MTGRPGNRASQTQAMPPASARQNDYFVPRDGIDREVITSDICRYLGNDALVRPGTYESPDGRATQGYFITAYRNLTSAMIQDLKVDSARWEAERRAASRSAAAGSGDSRNQPRGQDYNSWKNLQREQEFQASYASAMDIDYPPAAGVPGNPGYPLQAQYSGATTTSYPATSYPTPAPALAPQYVTQASGYVYTPPTSQVQYTAQTQTTAERFPAIPASLSPYAPEPFVHGSNFQVASGGGYANAGTSRMTPALPQVSAAPPRTFSAPTAGSSVYGTEDPYVYPPPVPKPISQAFPADGLYGRGPAQRPGYGSPSEAQYDDQPIQVHQGATTPTTSAAQVPVPVPVSVPVQMTNGSRPVRRGDRDSEPREQERDLRDHRARRPEPDDRHVNRHRR